MDGSSANRKLMKLHQGDNTTGPVYRAVNPYCNERYIYFISDPPHLIKTVHNCWNKRVMWVGVL